MTNHIFYTGIIYCHRVLDTVIFSQRHFDNNCGDCPYFAGTAQNEGIECKYEDGKNSPIQIIRMDTQVPNLKEQMNKWMRENFVEEE